MKVQMEARHHPTLDEGEKPSSRRDLLGRLAGLGLAAAGGMALLTGQADAKPKQRRTRRKGKKAPAPRRSQARHRQTIIVPTVQPKLTPSLLITRSITGNWWVQVTGKIQYTTAHINMMKAGYRYRITCVVWEYDYDDLYSLGDWCYTFPILAQHFFPRVPAKIPSSERFAFSADLRSAQLNHDDGHDEIYAQLTLWRKAPGGVWKKMSIDDTNMIKALF